MAKKTATSKKRNVRVDALGQLHVHSSFNNIIVSLANNEGQVISWSSADGIVKDGFKVGSDGFSLLSYTNHTSWCKGAML